MDLFCRDSYSPTGAFHLCAQVGENLEHVMRITQVGHALNDTRFSGKQGRGEDRQRRILRAADLDRTGKRVATVDENLIHTWQKGIVSRRYNRSSNKCRGNFFPPEPKETHLSGRVLFPRPASHRVEA